MIQSLNEVETGLTRVKNGEVDDAVAEFAEMFLFNDRGLGLEFTDRDRLHEFFQKEREFYPNASFLTKSVVAFEDYVIAEWLLKYTVREPFLGNSIRDVPVCLQGVSVVRTRNGRITEWSDYYDGLTSRRTALKSHFTDWIEY